MDPATAAFWRAASATRGSAPTPQEVARTMGLQARLVQEGLWDDAAVFLFVEATGTTARPFGGWTTNTMTLIGAPAWVPGGGLDFDGTNDYATVSLPGWNSQTAVTNLARIVPDNPAQADSTNLRIFSWGNFSLNRFYGTSSPTSALSNEVWTSVARIDGQNQVRYLGVDAADLAWTAGEDFVATTALTTSGVSLWKGTASIPYQLEDAMTPSTDVTPAAINWAANELVYMGASFISSPVVGYDGELKVWAVLKAELTTSQREWLTAWTEDWP
ncbi:MAG: hypothetical protein AAGK14_01605 [Verrucomicrobiota bacterium]